MKRFFFPSVSLGNNPAGEICLQLWLASNRAIWAIEYAGAGVRVHTLTHNQRRTRHKIDSNPPNIHIYSDGSSGGKRFHFISMRIWLASSELPLFELIMRWAFFRRNLCVSRFFSLSLSLYLSFSRVGSTSTRGTSILPFIVKMII